MYLFLSVKARQSSIIWNVLCRFHLLYHCCHSLSLIAICCHSLSLVVLLTVTLCYLLYHSLSLVVIPCHLLYYSLSLVVIRCHSLSFVVTRCTTHCHSLSFVVTQFLYPQLSIADRMKTYWGATNILKDTHREKAPSNESPALTKSTNMGIWVVSTTNQLFIRGS